MTWGVIGLKSGSSLNGLDIAFVKFTEKGGKWSNEIKAVNSYKISRWISDIQTDVALSAYEYQVLPNFYRKDIGG